MSVDFVYTAWAELSANHAHNFSIIDTENEAKRPHALTRHRMIPLYHTYQLTLWERHGCAHSPILSWQSPVMYLIFKKPFCVHVHIECSVEHRHTVSQKWPPIIFLQRDAMLALYMP